MHGMWDVSESPLGVTLELACLLFLSLSPHSFEICIWSRVEHDLEDRGVSLKLSISGFLWSSTFFLGGNCYDKSLQMSQQDLLCIDSLSMWW